MWSGSLCALKNSEAFKGNVQIVFRVRRCRRLEFLLHIKPFFDQHKESLDLLLNLHLHAFDYISASFRDSRSMTYPGSNLGAHESRHMHALLWICFLCKSMQILTDYENVLIQHEAFLFSYNYLNYLSCYKFKFINHKKRECPCKHESVLVAVITIN